MPISLSISPSAGMLYPEPVTANLCGDDYTAMELTVRQIGAIEREFAKIAGHPFALYPEALAALGRMADLPPLKRAMSPEGRLLASATRSWPPRMGSASFDKIMGTAAGAGAFLGRVLRLDPSIAGRPCEELAIRLDAEEWATIDAIAWGFAPWQTLSGQAPKATAPRPNDGMAWGEYVRGLGKAYGWTPAEIGEMFISQYFAAIATEDRKTVWIPDRPQTLELSA